MSLKTFTEYKTRCGETATVLDFDDLDRLYRGAVILNGNTRSMKWDSFGRHVDEFGMFHYAEDSPFDIIEEIEEASEEIEEGGLNGLNSYCVAFNKEVEEKGFWDSYKEAIKTIDMFGSNGLSNAVRDAFISQKIALIQSELGEALEAMRHNKYGLEKKDTFEDELADSLFRIFDLCGMLGIDIEKQLRWKRNHNKSREKLHGKGF